MIIPTLLPILLLLPSAALAVLADLGITDQPYYLMNSYTGAKYPLTADTTAVLPWTPFTNPAPNPLKLGAFTSLAFTLDDRGIDPITRNYVVTICDKRFSSDMQNQQRCLDVHNPTTQPEKSKVVVHMNAGDPASQRWILHPTGNPAWPFKLSNEALGPTRFLDTYSDTHQAFLSEGDFSGQYWVLVPVNPSPSTPPPVTKTKKECTQQTHFQFCEHNCPPPPVNPCWVALDGS